MVCDVEEDIFFLLIEKMNILLNQFHDLIDCLDIIDQSLQVNIDYVLENYESDGEDTKQYEDVLERE
jgi:hypothetical protein